MYIDDERALGSAMISKPTTIDELSHALELLLRSARNRAAPK
jgi:hypothetical protein